MARFNIGDTVVMKAGGPKMTIVYVGDDPTDMMQCRWYDGKKFQTEFFPPDSVRLFDDPDNSDYARSEGVTFRTGFGDEF